MSNSSFLPSVGLTKMARTPEKLKQMADDPDIDIFVNRTDVYNLKFDFTKL